MKNEGGMKSLRRRIIIGFLVVTLIAGIISTLLNILFETYADHYAISENSIVAVVLLFIGLNIAIYVVSGIVFYLLMRKAIRLESERQIQSNSLLYASVAHDLKTPITSIKGFAGALADGKIPDNEKEEIYRIIKRKSDNMNDLIDVLFEYSQLGTKEYEPVLVKTDLCALLREIIADNYCVLEENGITPEVDIPDTPIYINAEKRDLSRALNNLITNTYKHNPSGINMLVRVAQAGKSCVITIADTGNDIPEDMDVFEPFVTENVSRTYGRGTGLGLAVAKSVIERHNGTITLSRNIEGYTKAFVIDLMFG